MESVRPRSRTGNEVWIPLMNPQWQMAGMNLLLDLSSLETIDDVIRYGQTYGNSFFNHRRLLDERLILSKLGALHHDFPDFDLFASALEDSPFSREETVIILNDKRLSNILFWHLRPLLMTLGFRADKTLEIGSGMGEMTRYLYMLRKPARMSLLDLPTSLFFADVFLSASFPNERLCYFEGKVDPDARFILIPVTRAGQLELEQFDLIFNCGSMQEMLKKSIEGYCKLIGLTTSVFYSLNEKSTLIELPGFKVLYESNGFIPMIMEDSTVDRETIWVRE